MNIATLKAKALEILDQAPAQDGYTVLKARERLLNQYLFEDGCGEVVEILAKAQEAARR